MANKVLIAYFSASGMTERVAERLASVVDADLFRIEPEHPYSAADLDWNDESSRTSVEMRNPTSRPRIVGMPDNLVEYDTVLLGFPIWWYVAPALIKTFLESGDFSGKRVALFATSGGSGVEGVQEDLEPSAPQADWLGAHRFTFPLNTPALISWLHGLDIV